MSVYYRELMMIYRYTNAFLFAMGVVDKYQVTKTDCKLFMPIAWKIKRQFMHHTHKLLSQSYCSNSQDQFHNLNETNIFLTWIVFPIPFSCELNAQSISRWLLCISSEYRVSSHQAFLGKWHCSTNDAIWGLEHFSP